MEEGQKKGPQTIEKAKQGAYVARTVSGLQRVSLRNGDTAAVYENSNGELVTVPDYYSFLQQAIKERNRDVLSSIVLTVGIVANHGNWFSADVQNKEIRVLAKSYDWLLFLKDDAMVEFVEDVLQGDDPNLAHVRESFSRSFGSSKTSKFTKVTIDARADEELKRYFREKQPWDR